MPAPVTEPLDATQESPASGDAPEPQRATLTSPVPDFRLATPTATPVYIPTPATPIPLPTPHPGNADWVTQRLDSVVALYGPTPAGEALLHSLDVRQMQGEPGFFGSYGFYSWAGIGEAKPIPVMHELGHSYWGAFPVIGRPGVSWQGGEGGDIAAAMSAYHGDILAFMAQPPDGYELLRQRLRNLPGLSETNTEPLFHSLEADAPYTTGGDLSLVPPILRKYWGHFLSEGPFGSWARAAGWLQSLSHEERYIAGQFLGFEHLDLRLYSGLPDHSLSEEFLGAAREVLATEERQRLTDLAEQFDLLTGNSQLEENFGFWRHYLRDKVALHRTHPGHLDSLSLPSTDELSAALSFLVSLDGHPQEKVSALANRIVAQPIMVNFLPAVDDRTLVMLFASNPDLPDTPTLQATASFVERLQQFGKLVENVLAEGRSSPGLGAVALQAHLDETGLEQEHDLKLFFDLFQSADPMLARRIMSEIDDSTVQALMVPVPVQLRAIFDPGSLLRKLDITARSPEEDFSEGLVLLVEEASGNFRIDEPFLKQLFQVVAERADSDPAGVSRVIRGTPFPLEGYILSQPAAASLVLSADIDVALALVRESDRAVAPPARIIYHLIHADPVLAAALVAGFDDAGERELVVESLAYMAYDKMRSDKFPQLPISLAQDGAFLVHLIDRQGAAWLGEQLSQAAALYHQRTEAGEVDPDFEVRFRETVLAAAASAPSGSEALRTVVESALE